MARNESVTKRKERVASVGLQNTSVKTIAGVCLIFAFNHTVNAL